MTTVIAVRDGKKVHFASDSQATGGGTPFSVNKVYRVGPYTFAVAGVLSDAQATVRNLTKAVEGKGKRGKKAKKRGAKPSPEEFIKHISGHGACYILAVKKHLYEIGHDGSIVELRDGEPVAIGTGGDFAIGAVAAGASLQDALGIAIAFDVYSGGDIVTLSV